MQHDVSVSYSSKDRDTVMGFVARLRDAGINVWIDQGGIDGATNWGEEIVEAIESCKVLVLALSTASSESHNVVKEVSLALERQKQILPVNLEPVEVPRALRYPLAGIQHIDLFGGDASDGLGQVLRALARHGIVPHERKAAVSSAPVAAPASGGKKVIAVLPFANISPDKESDYFSDGLSEEINARLARIGGIKVVSRTNSMQYKGVKKDIETIGRELRAHYVLEGTVRRFENDLRITADLIDVETGTQLWADTYKGKMSDIFDIQEKVAKEILEALRLTLTPSEQIGLEKRATLDSAAFDLHLRARDFLYRLTKTNVQLAIDLFKKALERDPRYAEAHAGLGEAYALLYHLFERKEEYLDKAIEESLRALMYDAGVSEAYSALAQAYFNKRSFDEALQASRKATELNPDNFIGYWVEGRIFMNTGRYPEAEEQYLRTIAINPDFYSAYVDLHNIYDLMSDAAKIQTIQSRMMDFFPNYLARHPDDARAHMVFGVVLAQEGLHDEARIEGATALQLSPADPLMMYNAACFYALLGDLAQSIESLGNAIAAGFEHFDWIERDPDLAAVREDPGYIELLRRKGGA
jgi:TolB-like protein/Flp pilus assembly protein TadD